MISAAGLSAEIERRSLEIFAHVARAEAGIHAKAIDEVVFHEVGAIDSIVDIVAAAAALAWLAPGRISATPVAVGHGSVACAHGALPVPAPATLEILRSVGAPMIGRVPRFGECSSFVTRFPRRNTGLGRRRSNRPGS